MIQIRPEVLAAFQAQSEAALLDRVAEHVRAEHAHIVEGLPEPLVREMVANGLARARRHGLSAESSLTAFVALMFEIAPNFDEHPAARSVLTDARLLPDDRVEALIPRLKERHWREARHRYDERAWFPELHDGGEDDDGGARRIRIRIRR